MKGLLNRIWREDEGVLTFEWILLITVLTIGVVGGLSSARDAVISELGDVTQAVVSLDQSYAILAPWEITIADCAQDGAAGSVYVDSAVVGEGRGGVTGQQTTACPAVGRTDPMLLSDAY